MSSKRYAQVDKEYCVSCGTCTKACPLQEISVPDGISAVVELARCIGWPGRKGAHHERYCQFQLHRLRSVRP